MNLLLTLAIAFAAAITLPTSAQAHEADDHYLQLLQQMDATNIDVPLARWQASSRV
jgi:hypothetical protein